MALLEARAELHCSDVVEIDTGPAADPRRVELLPPYPNLRTRDTLIPFVLPACPAGGQVPVTLRIVDAAGRSVRRFIAGGVPAGSGGLAWNGRDERGWPVAGGPYLAVLDAAGSRAARKIAVRPRPSRHPPSSCGYRHPSRPAPPLREPDREVRSAD